MRKILEGSFPPRMLFTANGRLRALLYLLADGIYPDRSIVFKAISNVGNSRKANNFFCAQEAVAIPFVSAQASSVGSGEPSPCLCFVVSQYRQKLGHHLKHLKSPFQPKYDPWQALQLSK